MTRLLLDLYCGEGGAAMGYHRAGFDIIGIDHKPQPNFPFDLIVGDALFLLRELLTRRAVPTLGYALADFDAVHASPPCQRWSTITPDPSRHVDLIGPTRELLQAAGLPYIIENVEGARRELRDPVKLCGSSFGLSVRRHRYFETSFPVPHPPPCNHRTQGRPVGVYGDHPQDDEHYTRPGNGHRRGNKAKSVEQARDAMGMPWASWHGCTQAVPPAYTEWLGNALREA